MTDAVPENDRRAPYVATPGQTVFDIDFSIDAADELVVYQGGDLLDPTDYTVDIEAMTVTLDTGAALNDIVVIEGVTKSKIATEFPRGGGLNSAEVNKLARRFIWMIQEIIRNQGRVLSANPAESDAVSLVMPLLESNPGKLIGVNDDGDAIVMRAFTDFAGAFDLVETDPADNDFMIREGDHFVNKTVAQIRALLTVPDLPANLAALKTLYGLGNIVESNIAAFMATGTAPLISAFTGRTLNGLLLSNGADATNDVSIAAGTCISDDGATVMTLSAITKQLDAAWAVGNDQGGRDTGSISDATWHVWVIHRTDTGVTDVLLSTSATAPTMPTNYTKKKRIGSVVRASSAILGFVNNDQGEFLLKTPVLDINDTATGTTAKTGTLASVPNGIKVKAFFNTYVDDNGAAVYYSPLDATDMAVNNLTSGSVAPLSMTGTFGAGGVAGHGGVWTNTSRGFRYRTNTDTNLKVATLGWYDPGAK